MRRPVGARHCSKRSQLDMTGERNGCDIVHAGAFQVAVGNVEAGGLDDVYGNSKAGGKTQDRAGIAGDVGLIERQSEIGHPKFHLAA